LSWIADSCPDQNQQRLLSELLAIVHDDSVEITRMMGFTPAISTADSHFFRDVAIVSYGFVPFPSILKARQQKYMAIRNAFL
jgi:hypothetical protein